MFDNFYMNVVVGVVLVILVGVFVASVVHGVALFLRTIFDICDYPQMKKIKKMMIAYINANHANLSMEEFEEIEAFIERTETAAYYWHCIIEFLEGYISIRNKFFGVFKKRPIRK